MTLYITHFSKKVFFYAKIPLVGLDPTLAFKEKDNHQTFGQIINCLSLNYSTIAAHHGSGLICSKCLDALVRW